MEKKEEEEARKQPRSSHRIEYRRFRRRKDKSESKMNMGDASNKSQPGAGQMAEEDASPPVDSPRPSVTKQSTSRARRCRYFAVGGSCSLGEKCRFVHEASAPPLPPPDTRIVPPTRTPLPPVPTRPQSRSVSAAQLGSKEEGEIRREELLYFQRRFPRRTVEDLPDGGCIVRFEYTVLDPEWAFDVKAIPISLTLPLHYPIEMAGVDIPPGRLPDVLREHVCKACLDYIQARHAEHRALDRFEGIGRPFLRWLERSIFHLFVDGLKRTKLVLEAQMAGISLARPVRTETREESIGGASGEEQEEEENGAIAVNPRDATLPPAPTCSLSCSVSAAHVNEAESSNGVSAASNDQPTRDQVAVKLCLQWRDLSANIASLRAVALSVDLRCLRCNASRSTTCSPREVHIACCDRCGTKMHVNFDARIVHAYSDTIAVFSFVNCKPMDLILLHSRFVFVCLACNRETPITGIAYGSAHKCWCFDCHKRCEFVIDSSRFIGDLNSIPQNDEKPVKKAMMKTAKRENGPMIVLGQPLPDNGTCAHYKKSYRWLRFPCCGKLYPCDVCHAEKERDHEMKFANRMNYQRDKACVACDGSLIRKKTAFWEGGKGCRDKKTMARGDDRKYTNSRMKTVSTVKRPDLLEKRDK